MNLPCIQNEGKKLFLTTAGQRSKLGDDIFLKTHFPLKFRRYKSDEMEIWDESRILNELKRDTKKEIGNRVYILYGAAGSGKSETMQWLQTKFKLDCNTREFIRISRTEIDPIIILNKLLKKANKKIDKDLLIRWKIIKDKPVTISHNLVWNALNTLFDYDKEIIPICYKLRPIIEKNICSNFNNINKKSEFNKNKLELITMEELDEVITESAISIDISYEQLRKRLVGYFEKEVLGDHSFIETIKEVGRCLEAKSGHRPILFIDDLVQSLNIYSSDLLDFFITMDEGNWDIVIGLTPSSFESSKRGRELLTRIDNLDTFDDRLYKLWLTDQAGYKSYFLNEETVVKFVEKYMIKYKSMNGYNCGKECENYQKCIHLHWGENKNVSLTPLNYPLIIRMFNKLAKEKGKVRQLVLILAEYIENLESDNLTNFFERKIKREKYVNVDDSDEKIYIESLMPLGTYSKLKVHEPFFQLCNISNKESKEVEIVRLDDKKSNLEVINNIAKKDILQPELVAVRDWLENTNINKELLNEFRAEIASFILEFFDPSDLNKSFTSQTWSIYKYKKYDHGTTIPIRLEGDDSTSGLLVKRSIGSQAFKLMNHNEYKENQNYIDEIAKNVNIVSLINDSYLLKNKWKRKSYRECKIKCEELSFLLIVFLLTMSDIAEYPLILSKKYQIGMLQDIPGKWATNRNLKLSEEERSIIKGFFIDWFQIRSNFFDGNQLEKYIKKYPDILSILRKLSDININLSKGFKIKSFSAEKILKTIISKASNYYSLLTSVEFKNYCDTVIEDINFLSNIEKKQLNKINNQLTKMSFKYFEGIDFTIDIDDSLPCILDKDFPNHINLIVKFENSKYSKWKNDIILLAEKSTNKKVYLLNKIDEIKSIKKTEKNTENNKSKKSISELINYIRKTRVDLDIYSKNARHIQQQKNIYSKYYQSKVNNYVKFYSSIKSLLSNNKKINSNLDILIKYREKDFMTRKEYQMLEYILNLDHLEKHKSQLINKLKLQSKFYIKTIVFLKSNYDVTCKLDSQKNSYEIIKNNKKYKNYILNFVNNSNYFSDIEKNVLVKFINLGSIRWQDIHKLENPNNIILPLLKNLECKITIF